MCARGQCGWLIKKLYVEAESHERIGTKTETESERSVQKRQALDQNYLVTLSQSGHRNNLRRLDRDSLMPLVAFRSPSDKPASSMIFSIAKRFVWSDCGWMTDLSIICFLKEEIV
jgi:hypothetical protein